MCHTTSTNPQKTTTMSRNIHEYLMWTSLFLSSCGLKCRQVVWGHKWEWMLERLKVLIWKKTKSKSSRKWKSHRMAMGFWQKFTYRHFLCLADWIHIYHSLFPIWVYLVISLKWNSLLNFLTCRQISIIAKSYP